ncbi:hypothetical protein ACFQ3R_11305 [Mesonia ostreae]|uniref:Uncharacterized protein n=2 Tax=Mesonia ostreae TaxID=861110 RepID=A0ABU2KGX9_9FLAO|nr:hypothetical protein [Mesonia ostreae]MDT0293967.1 hypothetical protein [Mesonia ostreae]MDT0293968.1 hypothetical protein [Mesonia ostreae]
MRIFLILLLLTFTFGCATRNIKYDRNKILKKYSTEYKMFVDNEKTDLETVFLDKDNIESIRIDKRTRELKITQLKRTELFEMKNLNLDSLSAGQRGWNKKKIELVIIDGIPLTDSLLEKTKIDPNAIKSFNILSEEMMQRTNFCRVYDGNVILITTK